MSGKNYVVKARNLPLGSGVAFWMSVSAHLLILSPPVWVFFIFYTLFGVWIGVFLLIKLNETGRSLDRTLSGEDERRRAEDEVFSDKFERTKNGGK
jgi:hypothetical protein